MDAHSNAVFMPYLRYGYGDSSLESTFVSDYYDIWTGYGDSSLEAGVDRGEEPFHLAAWAGSLEVYGRLCVCSFTP